MRSVKRIRLFVGLAFLASVIAVTICNSAAQTTSSPTRSADSNRALAAQISTDSGGRFNLTARTESFARVGLRRGQTLKLWVRDLSNPKNNPPLFPGS